MSHSVSAMPPSADGAPTIVVLAAGRSTRFAGGHKLMQPFGASTVLATTIANALSTRLTVVVVTTMALVDSVCGSVARRDVVAVSDLPDGSPAFLRGMGHSIAAGVAARPHASGWLVLPGDMPMVQPSTMQAVARGLAQSPVAFAQHRGRRGHPVAFGSELFSELVQLEGDVGARRLIARYPGQGVETTDAGVLLDIDTEQDLVEAAALFNAVFGDAP